MALRFASSTVCLSLFSLKQCIIKQQLDPFFFYIRNNQGLGTCYQPQPSALADNSNLDLDHSGYHNNRHYA